MSAGDSVVWSVPAMEQGVEDITSVQKQLTAIRDDMNADLAPLKEFWVGSGNESYDQVQQRWNSAMGNMLELLSRIATALDRASQIHGDTERRVTGAWES